MLFLFKHFLAINSSSGPNSRLQARGSVDEFSRSLIFVPDDGSEAAPGCWWQLILAPACIFNGDQLVVFVLCSLLFLMIKYIFLI